MSESESESDSSVATSGRSTPVEKPEFPLKDTWALKYRDTINYKKGQTTGSWMDSFQLIYKISDAKAFWQVYSNMPWEPTIYSLFKEGIDPLWEDPANKNGFSIHYYGEDDEFMLRAILGILGGTIPQYSDVNGFMFDTKRKKYSIWYKCPQSLDLVDQVTEFLETDETPKVENHKTVEVASK